MMKDVSDDFSSPASFLFTDGERPSKALHFNNVNILMIGDLNHCVISIFFFFLTENFSSNTLKVKGGKNNLVSCKQLRHTKSIFAPWQPLISFQEAACSLVAAPIHTSVSNGVGGN